MKSEIWDEKKAQKAKTIVQYLIDNVKNEEKLFSTFLCLRLVIEPTDCLSELRDRLNFSVQSAAANRQKASELSAKTTTCRRVKRGGAMAQSFSLGTVSRAKFNRRSVRYGPCPMSPDGDSDDENEMVSKRYSGHKKVVDAFDEILNELENVRVSHGVPRESSDDSSSSPSRPDERPMRVRPSSIKQRPYSTFVPKNTQMVKFGESNSSEQFATDRDSGYLSQHNSQSSVVSSDTDGSPGSHTSGRLSADYGNVDVTDLGEIEQTIYDLIDFWSFHFTGDLHYPESLHLLMEILEMLRYRNQITLQQSAAILLRVNRHLAITYNAPKPIRTRFSKKSLKSKPFVTNFPAFKLASRLTHIEASHLKATATEDFIAKKSRNALDYWADWFNSLSALTASQVCLASNTSKAAKVIDHLIDVAMECCHQGNWNSAMAIALGLNLTPVVRLTKTWGKVKSNKLTLLKEISDPAKNFKNYRSKINSSCQIPFVSLLVKDACFQAQECKTNFEQCFKNFENFCQSNLIDSTALEAAFSSFDDLTAPLQQLKHPNRNDESTIRPKIDQNDELLNLVQTPVLDEDLLYLASFKLESASNQFDKNTYKQLKTKIFN